MSKRKVCKIKFLLIPLVSIFGLLLVLLTILTINSPGKIGNLKKIGGGTYENGISERVDMEIGGMMQGMFLVGADVSKPVILFLHGGPGVTEYYNNTIEENTLEENFVVCYWNQRGAGISYNNSISAKTMNIEQFINDAVEVTEYLKNRFGTEKIYLVGHSWGTILGSRIVEKHPDLYHAFLAIGYALDFERNESLAYQYMLQHAIEIDDQKAIQALKKYGGTSDSFKDISYITKVRTKYMTKYGIGGMHKDDGRTNKDLFKALMFQGFTLQEKFNVLNASIFSMETLMEYLEKEDLYFSLRKYQVPVYILQGYYDYQTSYVIAKEYFESIEAPEKAFYTFKNSAHCPNIEESELFIDIVKQIIHKK